MSVWFPTSLALSAEDGTLNKVLPSNAAAAPPGCTYERYQSSALHLYATWNNGGSGAGDTVEGTDVTRLASFASQDPSRVQVVGSVVRVSTLPDLDRIYHRSRAGGCSLGPRVPWAYISVPLCPHNSLPPGDCYRVWAPRALSPST